MCWLCRHRAKYNKAENCINMKNCKKFNFKNPVVTMGTFDGVHLGHQQVLKELKKKADLAGGESVVISYYHHPLETIHKKTFPYLLTEKDKKEILIKQSGIDHVIFLDFNERIADMSPEQFLKEIIIDEVGAREIIAGYDTHFGRFRQGNYQFLKDHESKYNYSVSLVEPLKINNRIISSSLIRDFIREGDMIDVAKCLGRKYSVAGSVITGHKIGRGMGFPTINVHPADPNKLIPGIGVYICEVMLLNNKYQAVTNIGYSPTLKKTGIKEIETHILDFDSDVYSQSVEVVFHKKLREEKAFDSIDELVKEIWNDVQLTREYFQT